MFANKSIREARKRNRILTALGKASTLVPTKFDHRNPNNVYGITGLLNREHPTNYSHYINLNDYRYLVFIEKVWSAEQKRTVHLVTIYQGPKDGLGDGIAIQANFKKVANVHMRNEKTAYALLSYVNTYNHIPDGFALTVARNTYSA